MRRSLMTATSAAVLSTVVLASTALVAAPSAQANGCSFASHAGTAADPNPITTAADLTCLHQAPEYWGEYFIQTADIDMSGEQQWTGATYGHGLGTATDPFSGQYDGGGFKVVGLLISTSGPGPLGLFGYIVGASIGNLGFTGTVTGSSTSTYVGGLIGYSLNTSVANSYATGAVAGRDHVGGLVGHNYISTVTNSFATGAVTSTGDYVGGLIGQNYRAIVATSYATGAVTSTGDYVGGLIGYNSSGEVSDSYATGAVATTGDSGGLIGYNSSGTVSHSFWDTETSGQSTSDGGIAKSTLEMTTIGTFTAASWSITQGFDTSSTWGICPQVNGGYPFLTVFHSSNPCTSASTSAMAEFRFFTPDGDECTSISPVRVPVGSMYSLPDAQALCQTMPGATVAGWTIPVPSGSTEFGSTAQPFPPGQLVRVTDSQRFTLIPFEPILEIVYDSNVALADTCQSNDIDHASANGRNRYIWVPRTDISLARFPSTPACTPPGHTLTGWNTSGHGTGTTYLPGDPLPDDWHDDLANGRTVYAVWRQASPRR